MSHLFVSLGLMNLLAAMAPGPDFAIVVHQVLQHGRRAGCWTALGISLALLVHMSYCAFGLTLIIQQAHWALVGIKFLGGSYLIYLGITAFRSATTTKSEITLKTPPSMSPFQACRAGFLTNVLNPKAMLFVLAMFTMVSSHGLHGLQRAFIAAEVCLIVFVWFCGLSWMMTHPKVYRHFRDYQLLITKVMGVVFILFGLALYFYHPQPPA
jgi:threonine/homoserine/homoserine lactone efflux protein